MKKRFVTILLVFIMNLSFGQTWSTTFSGIDSLWCVGGVSARCFYNDGDSILYIGGVVQKVNNIWVNGIFKWNVDYFDNFGSGISVGGTVESINLFKSRMFVAGGFWVAGGLPNTKYLGIWDGTNWSGAPGGEPDGTLYDLVKFENKLLIGGQFGQVGGVTAYDIIAYDGTDFINIGNMSANWVRALAVCDGTLYAGGNFGIRRYLGGTQWEDLPGNPGYYVSEMDVDTFNSFLYVGGSFNYVGDMLSTCVAMWDGFKWNSLGMVINCDIYDQAMAVYHGDLYVGGCIDTLYNDIDANGIARWDGTE